MNSLTIEDFENYFRELHGNAPFDDAHSHPPYDWQSRLVEATTSGSWPKVIDLPTGSGKTACIDVAVFSLACQASWETSKRTAPRRIFFCVNRRVIVDEAHQRARRIAERLRDAEAGKLNAPVLARVAAALRRVSTIRQESAPPLDVLELRGGIYRDNRWARSVTQPTIVCTTIDQLGSRLLFRGYGVSPNAAPIQAALIAYDSLVLLDEAHISRPFLQSLDLVKNYLDPQKWAEKPIGVRPMVVVPMTATPPERVGDTEVFRLEDKDRANEHLNKRLTATKKAKLLVVPDLAVAAVTQARALANGAPTAVGIIVNRVAIAKAIYDQFLTQKLDGVVELVIGSMRPIDRDQQTERLREIIGPKRPKITEKTSFVIATQCLEVGADYDFDALVTECASLDALLQRFGRLNRSGRPIQASAVILIQKKDLKENDQLNDKDPLDPIYGNALARTWNWMIENAISIQPEAEQATDKKRAKKKAAAAETRVIDFGINAFQAKWDSLDDESRRTLTAPSASKNAPVMLPAYVDIWCQTSPRPTPEPEVALFIHGPEAGEADVQVCWRADLIEDEQLKRSQWCDVVGLLPPTSAECMSVPISRLRRWLANESGEFDEGDVLGTLGLDSRTSASKNSEEERKLDPRRMGVLWRGVRRSRLMDSIADLRPGDTLVLPASAEGWNELGHVPSPMPIDVAEAAFRNARDRVILRLHPAMRTQIPHSLVIDELLARISDPEERVASMELRNALMEAANGFVTENKTHADTCRALADQRFGMLREYYPDDRGIVLVTRRRIDSGNSWFLPCLGEGDDDQSRTLREQPVGLEEHTRHVLDEVTRTIVELALGDLSEAYQLAAEMHDLGKADERFQAMLRRADRTDAWLFTGMESTLFAKSDGMPLTRSQRKKARERAGLPDGFRHEMLSVQIAERCDHRLSIARHPALILHLIAAHHGYARPFSPVVIENEVPPTVSIDGVVLSGTDRLLSSPHRLDSGIAERFWKLIREYGWWGLAYLEGVLRLADQQASAEEDAEVSNVQVPSVDLEEALR